MRGSRRPRLLSNIGHGIARTLHGRAFSLSTTELPGAEVRDIDTTEGKI